MTERDSEGAKKMFFYRDGQVGRKIDLNQIVCIKAEGRYMNIQCEDESFKVRYSLKRAMGMLPEQFCRTHGSYIVNIDKIDSLRLSDDEIQIGEQTIPIGRKFKKDFLQKVVIL